jgi:hypothetical protein
MKSEVHDLSTTYITSTNSKLRSHITVEFSLEKQINKPHNRAIVITKELNHNKRAIVITST